MIMVSYTFWLYSIGENEYRLTISTLDENGALIKKESFEDSLINILNIIEKREAK